MSYNNYDNFSDLRFLDPLLYDSPIASVYPYTFVYVPTLDKIMTANQIITLAV